MILNSIKEKKTYSRKEKTMHKAHYTKIILYNVLIH